jgi:hypothetical protein
VNKPPVLLRGFTRIDTEVLGGVHRTLGGAPGCVIARLQRLDLELRLGDVSAIGIPLGHALTRVHGIRLVDIDRSRDLQCGVWVSQLLNVKIYAAGCIQILNRGLSFGNQTPKVFKVISPDTHVGVKSVGSFPDLG